MCREPPESRLRPKFTAPELFENHHLAGVEGQTASALEQHASVSAGTAFAATTTAASASI